MVLKEGAIDYIQCFQWIDCDFKGFDTWFYRPRKIELVFRFLPVFVFCRRVTFWILKSLNGYD